MSKEKLSADALNDLEKIIEWINGLGPGWNLFGDVDRAKTRLQNVKKKLEQLQRARKKKQGTTKTMKAFCYLPTSGAEVMRSGKIEYFLCEIVDGVAYFPENPYDFHCKSIHNSVFIDGVEKFPARQKLPQDIYNLNVLTNETTKTTRQ